MDEKEKKTSLSLTYPRTNGVVGRRRAKERGQRHRDREQDPDGLDEGGPTEDHVRARLEAEGVLVQGVPQAQGELQAADHEGLHDGDLVEGDLPRGLRQGLVVVVVLVAFFFRVWVGVLAGLEASGLWCAHCTCLLPTHACVCVEKYM